MAEKKITILIEGMHCNHCSTAIAEGLKKVKGVISAEVLFTTGKAKVVYDPDAVKVENLTTVVKEMGYTVKGVKD